MNREVLNRELENNPAYVDDLFLEADYYDEFWEISAIPTKEILIQYFRGYNDSEIARNLGVHRTTVSRRISNFCAYLVDSEFGM